MKKNSGFLLFAALLLLFSAIPDIQAAGPGGLLNQPAENPVAARTAWSQNAAHPGDSIVLAVVVTIKKGFHINADAAQLNPIKTFKPYPTRVLLVDASEGITAAGALYPPAHPVSVDFAGGSLMSFGGRSVIYLPVKLDEKLPPGPAQLEILLEYQACTDTYCLFPQKITLKQVLAVARPARKVEKINQAFFADYAARKKAAGADDVRLDFFNWTVSINAASVLGWLLLLIAAFLGGMLLNLTPCVLPLIPIKMISLSSAAQDKSRCFALGLSMFLGVLVFWVALGAMIALVSGFTATSQLFHYPAFTLLVGIIIAAMGLGMFRGFSLRLPGFVYMFNPRQESLPGSFGLGILTAILSTPCTAPFMGAAAAWAATQRPLITLVTFFAIGFGMALPYQVLSCFPDLINRMPKSGPTSDLIKQIMGLFMLAGASYFIGVALEGLTAVTPALPNKMYWWAVMTFCAAAGAWLAWRAWRIAAAPKSRVLFVVLGLMILAASVLGAVRLTAKGPIEWIYFTPARFDAAVRQKKVVVMDFSAEWCLNCKALEQNVLNQPEIAGLLANRQVVALKVDLTSSNPAGKARLKAVGSLTIPLLVIYAPDGTVIFKSDFYTVEQVRAAIRRALQAATGQR